MFQTLLIKKNSKLCIWIFHCFLLKKIKTNVFTVSLQFTDKTMNKSIIKQTN